MPIYPEKREFIEYCFLSFSVLGWDKEEGDISCTENLDGIRVGHSYNRF